MTTAIRRWAVWQLPWSARLLVVAVPIAYLATVVVGLATFRPGLADFVTAAAFATASIVSVEVSMRLAWPRARGNFISSDGLGVWILPVALLLPPVYVAVMVLIPRTYVHFRIWRAQPMKFTYSTATLGLCYAAAAELRTVISGGHQASTADALIGGTRPLLALAVAITAWWVGHNVLVCAVVWLTAGKAAVARFVKNVETYANDAVAICTGVAMAVLWTVHPAAVALLAPPVLLMQHQLYSGLRQAVRRDLLTDLASPQYWRAVGAREVDRAWASGGPLAVLLIDIDHFKLVNDRFGHLVGDDVLAAVAASAVSALRPGDLLGRLGGEEFGAVLSGLTMAEAEGAAERVRAQVADVRVRSDSGEWISVTVSVGVSGLSVSGSSLHELVSAADRAMYAAKAAGRNCVRIASEGQTAVSVIDLR